MGQNIGRVGRRRRVLNEEVLAAGSTSRQPNLGNPEIQPGDTPRYGAGADIENHPQITDFVPRRYRLIGLVVVLSLAAGIAAEMVVHFANSLSEMSQVISAEELKTIVAGRFMAWTSVALLLTTACYARLLYSLRRHRVDDVRGCYRVWRTAGWAAVAMSLDAVTNIHEPLARLFGHFTGWQLLPGHVLWWLIPTGCVGGWLLLKVISDCAECRTALVAYGLALCCFAAGAAGTLGWSPVWLTEWPGIVSRAPPLAAHWLLLTGTLLYARYVVLDVQGLIAHRPTAQHRAAATIVPPESPAARNGRKATAAATESPASQQWLDGTEPENDVDRESRPRLSKAERKRLRKQKSPKRAA